MRSLICLGVLAVALLGASGIHAQRPPIRSPERTGEIVKITLATAAEKKAGLLATVTIKSSGAELPVRITPDTRIWISAGKLGNEAKVEELRVGEPVSVWFKKDAMGSVRTEQFMVFRAGEPRALPPG